jgi:hypothetical protein
MNKNFRNRNLLDPVHVWYLYKIYREHELTGTNYPDLARKYNIKATDMYNFINRYKYKIRSNPVLYKTLLEKYTHFLELKKEMGALTIDEYMTEYYPGGDRRHFPEMAIHLKVNKIISEYLLKFGEPLIDIKDNDKQMEFFSFPVAEKIHTEEIETHQEIINPEPSILVRDSAGSIVEYQEKPAKNDLELMLMDGVSVSIKKTVCTENVFKIINLLRAV